MAIPVKIFVSYAQVDDQPYPGIDQGWVATFVKILGLKLASLLGRADHFEIWMDYALRVGDPLTESIFGELRSSHLLLVVASPGYLQSAWCQAETETFLEKHLAGVGRRVFRVDRLPVELDRVPRRLRDILSARFWVADAPASVKTKVPPRTLGDPRPPDHDSEYWRQMDFLADSMASAIREAAASMGSPIPENAVVPRLRSGTGATTTTAGAGGGPVRVFLAESADLLETERDEVLRFLGSQKSIDVRSPDSYPRKIDEYESRLAEDLRGCKAFVQVLGEHPGPKVPGPEARGRERRYARIQYEAAVRAEVPIFQWLSPTLDLAGLRKALEEDTKKSGVAAPASGQDVPADMDPSLATRWEHLRFLEGPHVRQEGLPLFIQALQRHLVAPPPPPAKPPLPAFIFVNSELADDPIAIHVAGLLEQEGQVVFLPLREGEPQELLKDMTEHLAACDALVLIHGAAPPTWVRNQFLLAKRVRPTFLADLRAMGLVKAPPPKARDVGIAIPRLSVLDCQGLDFGSLPPHAPELRAALQPFLQCLQA